MSGFTGGFNKIIRNIVAGASDTEFEKVIFPFFILQRLTKCTFHLDNKEPKEKHVICKCEPVILQFYWNVSMGSIRTR